MRPENLTAPATFPADAAACVQVATEFLCDLCGQLDPELYRYALSHSGDWAAHLYRSDPEGIGRAAADAVRQARTHDVYVRTTALGADWQPKKRGARGDAADSRAVMAIGADIDIAGPGHAGTDYPPKLDDALEVVRNTIEHEPSYVIDTGGGVHVWWVLVEPFIIENVDGRRTAEAFVGGVHAQIGTAFEKCGWRFDATADLARILRVPGTYNHKKLVT